LASMVTSPLYRASPASFPNNPPIQGFLCLTPEVTFFLMSFISPEVPSLPVGPPKPLFLHPTSEYTPLFFSLRRIANASTGVPLVELSLSSPSHPAPSAEAKFYYREFCSMRRPPVKFRIRVFFLSFKSIHHSLFSPYTTSPL